MSDGAGWRAEPVRAFLLPRLLLESGQRSQLQA